jgi:hypothetical protein
MFLDESSESSNAEPQALQINDFETSVLEEF